MKLEGDNLKMAIQRQGRLAVDSVATLKAIGLDFDSYNGRLFSRCRNFPLDILFLRDDDIPEYVQDGVADLGVVGLNIVHEKNARVSQLDLLGFGSCTLTIAVPADRCGQTVYDLGGKRIATSYPRTLREYLRRKSVEARVIEISGSVEIAPSLDVADAICDLVSTGSTLKMNGLTAIETVLRSEAVLIANPATLRDGARREVVDRLRIRAQSHLRARKTKYVMMNAPRSALEVIRGILPGMKSPTVLPLAEEGMIAVHSAVPEEVFWEVIEKLQATGASDILVLPVEKLVAC